jgi:hypothetical protein
MSREWHSPTSYPVSMKDLDLLYKSHDLKVDLIRQCLEYIMSYRLENYGYEHGAFKKLSNKKSTLKSKLNKYINETNIFDLNLDAFSRFYFNHLDFKVFYAVNHSPNEEIIKIMEDLLNK